jgi:hypothetical protein
MTVLMKSLGCGDMHSLSSTPLPNGGDELLNTSHESKASSAAQFGYQEVMKNEPKRDQKNSPLAVREGGGDDDGAEDNNESSLCLPSEQETFLLSENRLVDKNFTMKNCLISCRFILAVYIWFREFTVPIDNNYYSSFDWHHTMVGLPTSCLIVIWKSMELFDKCKDKNSWCAFSLSTFEFLGSLAFLANSILISFCKDSNECYDNFGINPRLGWLPGIGTMILANVLKAFIACCKTCCCCKRTGKNCLNTFVEKTAPPVLQALAFCSFSLLELRPTDPLVAAWSGLFFVWEGIVLCGLKNKSSTAALARNWNAIFKILASVSFWVISGNFDRRSLDESQRMPIEAVLVLPLLLLLMSFDVFFGCILSVGFLAFIYTEKEGDGLLLISSVLLLWSLVKWLRVCWMRAAAQDGSKESVFRPCGEFFNIIACVLLFAQNIVMRGTMEIYIQMQENEKSDTLMFLNIGVGIFYFVHFICWVKVEFHLGENYEDSSPKYILSEDTYTLMMYANTFSQTWLISFAVFLLQAVLIAMIMLAQWEQNSTASHFLDVPYDATLPTRIGQVAGMMLITKRLLGCINFARYQFLGGERW